MLLLLFSSPPASSPNRGKLRVWDGSNWVIKPVKVWDGSNWVVKPVRYWTGSKWAFTFDSGPVFTPDSSDNGFFTTSGVSETTPSDPGFYNVTYTTDEDSSDAGFFTGNTTSESSNDSGFYDQQYAGAYEDPNEPGTFI